MDRFFEMNDTPDISPTLLWESFKAFTRGVIISYQAFQNKKNKNVQRQLEEQIRQLDIDNTKDPTTDTHNKILILKFTLHKLLSEKIIRLFQITKQDCFEFGDKPHQLFARQLKKRERDHAILKIKSDRGELLTLPNDINKRFAQYYKNLYTSKTLIDNNKASEFWTIVTSQN